MRLLAVDPGVNAIGYAYWDGVHSIPNEVGVIESKKEDPFSRVQDVVKRLSNNHLLWTGLHKLAIEWPEVMSGAKGHAAAARGDVSRLAFCGGMLVARCEIGTDFQMVPVTTWKGQLKKEIVIMRLKRFIGDEDLAGRKIVSHAWDAVGIGLYTTGLRLDDKMFAKRKTK